MRRLGHKYVFFYLFHVLCILTNFLNYIYVRKRFGWVAQQKMGPLYFFKKYLVLSSLINTIDST